MLTVQSTTLSGVKVITPRSFLDNRGSFTERYNAERFRAHGILDDFIQDNESRSVKIGTIRGLHFQSPPTAQTKLVRVLRGRIQDIAVDIRRQSPTYGHWISVDLSADDNQQVLVPIGFAHGFCTLEPDTVVLYKVSASYSPEHEHGIVWNDADLAIDWKFSGQPTISKKDADLPTFRSLTSPFE